MSQNLLNRITRKPDISHGKPTIRGLRYPVDTMLDLMASGMSIDEILTDYRTWREKICWSALNMLLNYRELRNSEMVFISVSPIFFNTNRSLSPVNK